MFVCKVQMIISQTHIMSKLKKKTKKGRKTKEGDEGEKKREKRTDGEAGWQKDKKCCHNLY